MKYRGRIVTISILFIISVLLSVYFRFEYIAVIGSLLAIIPAWWLGKQFDKVQFLNQALKQSKDEQQSFFDNHASYLWSILI